MNARNQTFLFGSFSFRNSAKFKLWRNWANPKTLVVDAFSIFGKIRNTKNCIFLEFYAGFLHKIGQLSLDFLPYPWAEFYIIPCFFTLSQTSGKFCAFLGKFLHFFGSQELFILFSWWFHRLRYSESLLLAVFSLFWRCAAWLTCRVPLLAQLRAFGSAPGVPASPLPVFLLLLEADLHLFAAWLP